MSSADPVESPSGPVRRPVDLVFAMVRGVGQVDLQPSLLTGALILASLWVAGWQIGLFATIGTAVSTVTAVVLQVDRNSIAQGLQGYCGCLTGIALVASLGNHLSTYLLAVCGGFLCTVLTATLGTLTAPFGLTALTAPFCVISGVMVAGASSFSRIWHGGPATAVTSTTQGSTRLSWSILWHAFLDNVSEVFLVSDWKTGLIMLIGLACAGWLVVSFAVVGSLVGILASWALGAPTSLVAEGIYGYNAVLVAVAMGAVYLRPGAWNTAYVLVAGFASTGLTASVTSLFKPFGGHTFTWPFILTTWAFMAAVPALPRFRRAG